MAIEDIKKSILQNAGIISSPEGLFCTFETRNDGTVGYTLDIIGKLDNYSCTSPLSEKKEHIEERLACYGENEIEFTALNTHYFPSIPKEFWYWWDPLHHGGNAHTQIYDRIFREVKKYNPQRTLILGCGIGSFLEKLQKEGFDAEGIDAEWRNIEKAKNRHLKVREISTHQLREREAYDLIIEPGIFSAGVVTRAYVEECLPKVKRTLKKEGHLIHAPYARSLLHAKDFEKEKLSLEAMSVPKNLFTWEYPKQMYIARK